MTVLVPLLVAMVGVGPWASPAASDPQMFIPDTAHPADTTSVDAPVGREAAEALEAPPLVFDPPDAQEHEVLGVPVYHLHDPTLPLVDVHVHVRGGPGHFARGELAATSALPPLLRTGGTGTLPPDSVELRLDLMALQLAIQSGGGGTFVSLNTLTQQVNPAMELLGDILLDPGFDPEALEVWRGAELERIRRRQDDPTSLAYSAFNRLVFGDHPVGWVTEEEDLVAGRLSEARLRELHAALYCKDRLVLGLTGDLAWNEAEPLVRAFVERWPECAEALPEPPVPELRRDGAIFVLPREIDQSTVIVAGPGGIRQEASPDYFASRIGNHVLGGGLGSRLSSRVRTEQGLAYWASSLWTAPIRYEGLFGAVTATRADRTVETTRLLLDVLNAFRDDPPDPEEVERAIEEIVAGFVFAFESAFQIVSRRIGYRVQGLPADWLEGYLEGLQAVTPEAVHAAAREHLDLEEMTVLVVGDPARFDPGLEALGRVYELFPDGSYQPWVNRASGPHGSPRSPR